MSSVGVFLLIFLTVLLATALAVVWRRAERNRRALEDCSDSIQEIFKVLEEPSAVARILSQETPHQELERLKDLLKQGGQKALQERDALLRVFANLPDGIVALDSSRSVVFCNDQFCRLVHIPDENHAGEKIFEVLRHHSALNAVENYFNQGREEPAEVEFSAGDNKIKMSIIRFHGSSAVEVIVVLSDVTALKKLENMRRDFVANVSHELRTPLTSIQGFVETLLDGKGIDDATRKHFLGLIQKDSERLRRLIEDLLVLSRVESQARDFEKHKVHALTEVDEALVQFGLRLKQKQMILKKNIETGLTLSANRDQLRQVLINLIDNAIKFSPEKGAIDIFAVRTQDGVEIRVGDSGSGVAADNREKIFQRFFREDKARSRETGGTGLGLAIVKHIMEAHGGSARCISGAGDKGAVFVLYFPDEPVEV